MSITTRLFVFVLAIAGAIALWQWHVAGTESREVTELALRQFQNDADVPANLQLATQARNWWPFLLPALIVVLGIVMFWDDVERWWQQEDTQ